MSSVAIGAPCAIPFLSGCPTEEVYVFPCEPEPALEHVGLRCTQCGMTVSATRAKKEATDAQL
jgi:hypothetical protein